MLCSYRGKATGIISSFYLNIYIYIYNIFDIFVTFPFDCVGTGKNCFNEPFFGFLLIFTG